MTTAISNSGYRWPHGRTTINLAPADVKKEGPSFDLPIALSMIAVAANTDLPNVEQFCFVGELALTGQVRPVKGVLPVAIEARRRGRKAVVVPEANAREAAMVEGIEVYGVCNLREGYEFLTGEKPLTPVREDISQFFAIIKITTSISPMCAASTTSSAPSGGRRRYHNALTLGLHQPFSHFRFQLTLPTTKSAPPHSMKLLFVSTSVLWDKTRNHPYPGVVEGLRELAEKKDEIFLVSSHSEPAWLKTHFPYIRFQASDFKTKQTGEIVALFLDANRENLRRSDVVVFGATNADFFMAVNSQCLLVRCEWTRLEDRISHYGVPLRAPEGIPHLVEILRDKDPWYFSYRSKSLDMFSLTNAGTIGETDAGILALVEMLNGCLKSGKIQHRHEFIAHLLSSLCVTDDFRGVDWWGWYPSSTADSADEVMKEFCTLARTTFGKSTKGPLFVRHKTTVKRSRNRKYIVNTDPSSEVESLYINSVYKGRLEGTTVAVLDDYLTYGLSFGVAEGLLRKAGATKVIGVAMGKFGNRAEVYNLQIATDRIYEPIKDYTLAGHHHVQGIHRKSAQDDFAQKFRHLL